MGQPRSAARSYRENQRIWRSSTSPAVAAMRSVTSAEGLADLRVVSTWTRWTGEVSRVASSPLFGCPVCQAGELGPPGPEGRLFAVVSNFFGDSTGESAMRSTVARTRPTVTTMGLGLAMSAVARAYCLAAASAWRSAEARSAADPQDPRSSLGPGAPPSQAVPGPSGRSRRPLAGTPSPAAPPPLWPRWSTLACWRAPC